MRAVIVMHHVDAYGAKDMLLSFYWLNIIEVAGWSLWGVIICNGVFLTLIYERIWYLWQPLRQRVKWLKKITGTEFKCEEWEKLFFEEQRRLYISFPLIKVLIIVCPLIGLLGGLLNFMQMLQQNGFEIFYVKNMHYYIFVHLVLPLIVGVITAILGLIVLMFYLRGLHSFIRNYSKNFSEKSPLSLHKKIFH